MAELRLQQTPEQRGGTAQQASSGVVSAERAGLGRVEANRPMGIQAPQGIGGVAQRGDQIIADANLAAAKLRGDGEMAVANAKANMYNTVINTVSNTANAYFDMQKRQEAERKRQQKEEEDRLRAVEDFKLEQGTIRAQIEWDKRKVEIEEEANQNGYDTNWIREKAATEKEKIIQRHLGEDKFVDQQFIKPKAELLRERLDAKFGGEIQKETKLRDVQEVKAGFAVALSDVEIHVASAKSLEEFNERMKSIVAIATHPTFQATYNPIEQATLINGAIHRVQASFAEAYALRIDEGMMNARSSRDASAIGNQMLGEYENVLNGMSTLQPDDKEKLRNKAAGVVKATTKQLQVEERQRAIEARVQQNAAREQIKDRLVLQIERAEAGIPGEKMPTLQEIEKVGAQIGADKHAILLNKWSSANKKIEERLISADTINYKVSNGIALTSDKEINTHYDMLVQGLGKVAPERRADVLHQGMSAMAGLPPKYENEIKGLFLSTNEQAFAEGVARARSLQKQAPHLYAKLPEQIRAEAAMAESGMSVEQIMDVRKKKSASTPAEADLRSRDWNKQFNDMRNNGKFDSALRDVDGVGRGVISERVRADVVEQARQLFLSGYDMDTAIKVSTQNVGARVGQTEVGGKKQIVYDPPEKVFATTSKNINEALSYDLKTDIGVEIDPKKIRLERGGLTKSGQPFYMVMKLGNDGMWKFVTDKDGKEYRWTYSHDSLQVVRDRNAAIERERQEREAANARANRPVPPLNLGPLPHEQSPMFLNPNFK